MKSSMPCEQETAGNGSRVLRVMHVINSMFLGGTEKAMLKVITGLTPEFEHRVCCIRDYDRNLIASRLQPEQVLALNLPASRFGFFVPALLRAIRSCKPDVVHSRNWGTIEAALAARLAGVPVVVHSEHGYEVESLARTPVRQRWMRRLVFSLADAVFTVSEQLREFHASQAGTRPERIRVLRNGVDTKKFAPNPMARTRLRSELGVAPEDFVIGAVGRLVPIKDYATLIRAAGCLAAQHSSCKLLLVGDGPELVGLREMAQSLPGMADRLLTVGQREDVADLLSCMDVFVQTSLGEGMSNTILEAMASGLPAIVTRVGGNPEMVTEECGRLFAPGDVDHLSQLLLTLAEDRGLRARVGEAARRRTEETFSNQAMLDHYRQLYLELARKQQLLATWNWADGGLQTNGIPRT